ncbi:hypothetical protein QL285_015093 [Trifolium repens]|nr:hypothetical protein QL285_015093 [Trifolium repens]
MEIRPDLWPNESGKYVLVVYAMTNRGRKDFLATLKNINVPDGYSSNISRCIDLDNDKLNGMLKSHDCHVLKEQLLPLAKRTSLLDEVSAVLIELCSFFRQLCARPEGSIAEGYLLEEILTFCSRYLDDIETRWNRHGRADDEHNDKQPQSRMSELFPLIGKPVGGSSYFTLTQREKLQAHRHVLTNCPVVDYYIQQFRTVVKRQMRGRHSSEIGNNLDSLSGPDKDVLISLAQGPLDQARRFTAYNVNGFKFRTLA